MADAWRGKFLDRMDALDMWKDSAVILTIDHGHLLGEHDCWARRSRRICTGNPFARY